MGYPIQQGDRHSKAVAGIVRHDLGQARNRVSVTDHVRDQAHGARTAIKKVKAAVRVVRAHRRPTAQKGGRPPTVARAISTVQQVGAGLQTLATAGERRARNQDADLLRRLRAVFSRSLDQASLGFWDTGSFERIGRRPRVARGRAKPWLPDSETWRTIGAGLVEGYDRARQAMALAYQQMTCAAFQAWRRAAKSHRYQLDALRVIEPNELGPRLDKLDRLGNLLADEHDLATLEEMLERDGAALALFDDIEQRRSRLLSQARRLGLELFTEDPRRFQSKMKEAFSLSENRDP